MADNLNIPYDLDAEKSVLGCILKENECYDKVKSYLEPSYFYLKEHQTIFSAMIRLNSEKSTSIDPVVVARELASENNIDEIGGRKYLFELIEAISSTVNVVRYAEIVKEQYNLRNLLAVSNRIIDQVNNGGDTSNNIIDAAEQMLYDARQGRDVNEPKHVKDVIINDLFEDLAKLSGENKEQFRGIATGYTLLDSCIMGLNKSDLVIVGGRPGMGKTAFALNMAAHAAINEQKKVLFFSLEMSKSQLAGRLLAAEAYVEASKFRNGNLKQDEWDRLTVATERFYNSEFYIDDTAALSVAEIKARTRRLKNVDVVFIDYLGLVQSNSRRENRVQEVSEVTRNLKMMAKDLNIPIVVCAQLSRASEGRGKSHKPILADIRESGSIEQDADIVMFVYRENYYSNEIEDDEDEEIEDSNSAQIIVAKNRHGEPKNIDVLYEGQYVKFFNLDKNGQNYPNN